MPPAMTMGRNQRWRAPVLAASVLAIVVGPFILRRLAEERTGHAPLMVAAALPVAAHVQVVSSAVRNMGAATIERALGAGAPVLEERLDYSRTILVPTLDRIEELTRDSPEQQVRAGTLRQSILQRLDQIQRVVVE